MTDSLLDRYLRRPDAGGESPAQEPVSDADGAETVGCFGWHRGTRDFPRMLELRKRDGSIVAIGYAWIERVDFDPDQGITLHAQGRKVRITGRNLNAEVRPTVRLYQGIVRHKVAWVEESGSPQTDGVDPHSIQVTALEC